ncbi:MAG: magnesium chelatase family protein [Patescibacteria group bacterium]|jgi:magnesium chelatase family protein|nr:magnesium chelatase family protein [Patescibacteria group bacterium]
MFSRVYSAQVNVLDGELITIETDISKGLHNFSVVGLPDKAVEEARDRVGSAIKNSGLKSPKQSNQKIVVSLSPANVKKEGSYFDLAIALGYLLSNEEIKFNPEKKAFVGELSLNGELKPVKGILALIKNLKKLGFEEVFVPDQNKEEAALIEGVTIFPAKNLLEVINHLKEEEKFSLSPQPITEITYGEAKALNDFSDIKGQDVAKRGLIIAAAGGHNIAMYGPPGTGKTMLARAFSGILPPLSKEDILEITGIHSVAGILKGALVTDSPFRSPHNTSSYVSVIGGGTFPKPGEVTLAHKGVLFLDEFPEFDRRVIESLRQPLEDRVVHISRSKGTAVFPTNFILIAAMNPPPDDATASDIVRFKKKISGPIMDRIDMWVDVPKIDYNLLGSKEKTKDTSEEVRKIVIKARDRQLERLAGSKAKTNSEMSVRDLDKTIKLSDQVKEILNMSAERLSLSARAYHRIIKLARTIADLDDKEHIETNHILEALQYRPKQEY